ncbi:MAG: endo-1,4-beta-xylanase [Treponema sp.]|nr:endo-1,4-beta-xylanase [Treponema sp.]
MKKLPLSLLGVLSVFTFVLIFGVCTSVQSERNEETGVDIMTLPPLKDQFSRYFMIGSIFHNGSSQSQGGFPSDVPSGSASIANRRLTHHFNVITHENELKPASITRWRDASTGEITYNWEVADRMINAALASDLKVVGHTLLWHGQIPDWQIKMADQPKNVALTAMKQYISDVVGRYAGKIYSWDVLNEGIAGGGNWKTNLRMENPWFKSIGADFVYEGFLAARKADPAAILYYNDYNLNDYNKALAVRDMVRDVNAQYLKENGGERLLIEGIGMQSHHNTDVTASSVKNSINLFRPLGVKLAITELDILSQSWGEYSSRTAPSSAGKNRAAGLYGELFKVFLENSDIIERVTFWGCFDQQSWRARALPLIFEGYPKTTAKPAYFRIIQALEKFEQNRQ